MNNEYYVLRIRCNTVRVMLFHVTAEGFLACQLVLVNKFTVGTC
jgi:hypothetical protein